MSYSANWTGVEVPTPTIREKQLEILRRTVADMRDAQVHYFASVKEDRAAAKASGMHWRAKPPGSMSADWLRVSKELEAEVDRMLADLAKTKEAAKAEMP